jgi:hypothetical protein
LVIGAALDEALGADEQQEADAARVDSALRRLKDETTLALGPAPATVSAEDDAPTPVAVRFR